MKRWLIMGALVVAGVCGVAAQDLGTGSMELTGTEVLALQEALDDFSSLGHNVEVYRVILQWLPPDYLSVAFLPTEAAQPAKGEGPELGIEIHYVIDTTSITIVERSTGGG